MNKNFKLKKIQTVDDFHHVTCFVVQKDLPTATGDI